MNDNYDLPNKLRNRACPAGLPWVGQDPTEDHGHTDCFLLHQAADELDRLQSIVDQHKWLLRCVILDIALGRVYSASLMLQAAFESLTEQERQNDEW